LFVSEFCFKNCGHKKIFPREDSSDLEEIEAEIAALENRRKTLDEEREKKKKDLQEEELCDQIISSENQLRDRKFDQKEDNQENDEDVLRAFRVSNVQKAEVSRYF